MITIQPLLVQHPDLVNRIRRSEWWHKPHRLKHLGYQKKKGAWMAPCQEHLSPTNVT